MRRTCDLAFFFHYEGYADSAQRRSLGLRATYRDVVVPYLDARMQAKIPKGSLGLVAEQRDMRSVAYENIVLPRRRLRMSQARNNGEP